VKQVPLGRTKFKEYRRSNAGVCRDVLTPETIVKLCQVVVG